MREIQKKSIEVTGKGEKKLCLLFQKPLLILCFSKMLDTCSKFPGGAQESNVLSNILFCITQNLLGYQHFSVRVGP